MKVIFLGYAVSNDYIGKLSGLSVAGNKMQVNCLKGLNKFEDIDLSCVTVYPVAPYPKDRSFYVSGKTIKIADDLSTYRVPFLNIPVIKQFIQTLSVWKYSRKIVTKDSVVFTFNMFPQVGLPAVWLKRKYGCKIFCLLADLPIDDNVNSKNAIRNYLRKRFESHTEYALNETDFFITLNKNAVDTYCPGKDFIVVEGGVNLDELVKPLFNIKNDKRIIYSGALTEYSGIRLLVDAMRLIKDKDAVLEIYGGGYIEEEIKKSAEESKNIIYKGKINNTEMMAVQRDAYLLINPRPSGDCIAQMTFPSKMFEYMTSGTPVLTTRLNGLSDDFLEHLYTINEETPMGFALAIDNVLSKSTSELLKKAQGAYDFITKQKNWNIQTQRIHDYIIRRTKDE